MTDTSVNDNNKERHCRKQEIWRCCLPQRYSLFFKLELIFVLLWEQIKKCEKWQWETLSLSKSFHFAYVLVCVSTVHVHVICGARHLCDRRDECESLTVKTLPWNTRICSQPRTLPPATLTTVFYMLHANLTVLSVGSVIWWCAYKWTASLLSWRRQCVLLSFGICTNGVVTEC